MKNRNCLRCDRVFVPTVYLTRTCERCFERNSRQQDSAEWDLPVKRKQVVKISEMESEDDNE